MSEKGISQHKRLAMGDQINKYATGGMVTPRMPKMMGAKMPKMTATPAPRIPGMPMNPVTKAKMDNGILGMKRGGKC